MDEKLEPVEPNSGHTRTRTARRKKPEASQGGAPSPASKDAPKAASKNAPKNAARKKSGPRRQSSSDNSTDRTRKSSRRKAASGARPLQDSSNTMRSGVRKPSKRKAASGSGPLQSSSTDVRSELPELPGHESASAPAPLSPSADGSIGLRKLPEHDGVSLPPPPSPSNNVPGGTRSWLELKTATAIVMVVGFAACLALASYYGERRGEPVTSVPGCDSGLCSSPIATATVVDSHPAEIPQQQAIVPACDSGSCSSAATDTAVAGHHRDEAPITGRMQNADKPRQLAPRPKSFGPGLVVSRKTGARARVGVAHAARFQAYVDDLEANHGARILFIGGIRPGHCASSSLHPCGRALDVCQLSRGVVDSRCHLPPRRKLAQIASSHGLFEGGRWCNSDYGHAQLGATAGDCGARRTHIGRRRAAHDAFASFR